MDEKDMEKQIEFLATTTLGALKHLFERDKLNDRQSTLCLYYFLSQFVKNGWKGHQPSQILEDAIRVIKSSDDYALPKVDT